MNTSTTLNIHNKGERPLMILAHGVGADASMWRPMAAVLDNQYETVLLDWVGSGQSDLSAFDPLRYASLHAYADDLNELIMQYGARPVIFIGHGVGGTIGVLAALEKPEYFASQVLIATSPCYVNDGDYQGGFTRPQIEQMLKTIRDESARLRSNHAGFGSLGVSSGKDDEQPAIAPHFARLGFLSDHRADMANSTTRTLIIQGKRDLIVPTAVGKFMHSAIPGSVLRIVEMSGRLPDLSPQGQIAREIQTFLGVSP